MKIVRWCSALLAAALLLVGGTAQGAPTRLTLLHVNDTHSRLDAYGPKDLKLDGLEGGLTKAATVIGLLERLEPNAFLVHAGDAFHGDLYFPRFLAVPEYSILSQLGLVAYGVGNHEFEYTADAFRLAIDGTFAETGFQLPAVTANLNAAAAGVLGDRVLPYRIVGIAGVRIGFFGLTIPEFQSMDAVTAPPPGQDPVTYFVDLALAQVQALRAVQPNGDPPADVVVFLSHLGMPLSRAIAAAGIGIDVVVQGHDHQYPLATPEQYGNTILVSAGAFYRYVGDLRLVYDPAADPKVKLAGYHLFSIDAAIPREPTVRGIVNGLKATIIDLTKPYVPPNGEDFWHKRIAFALAPFEGEAQAGIRNRSTAVGNLVTDIYRTAGGERSDIGMEASGFAEVSLPWGAIVGADVFRMMSYGYDENDPITGFGAQLVRFELTGPEILTALNGGMALSVLQVSGMRYAYDSRLDPSTGQVLPESVFIGGRPIALNGNKTYTITTTDTNVYVMQTYLQITPRNLTPLFVSAYEALRDGVTRMAWLVPNTDARVRDLALP